MLITIVNGLLAFSSQIGYWGIVLLMSLESSLIPFPSEVVIPPAAYLAAQGHFNIYLVVVAGVLGSLIGAIFNYFLALYLGRAIVYRFTKTKLAAWLLLSPEKLERAESFFRRFDKSSTFFGRLVPVVRQLISLPAGFSRMPFASFLLYTFLGSAIWTIVLAALGYFFGANEALWHSYYRQISWGLLIFAFLLIAYLAVKKKKK